jgi:glycerol uptake facilitator-like aquaporin
MSPCLGEITGAAILLLLGNGVVANVVLTGTKGNGAGWIVIAWGWGMGKLGQHRLRDLRFLALGQVPAC